jgi:uncharacterized membrane protein YdjX (TVP38/TMEM64 family)
MCQPVGRWVRIAVAFGLIAATAVCLVVTPLGHQIWDLLMQPTPERLSHVLPHTAFWVAVALIGLMVLHTLVPLPAELLAVVAGMTLGPVWGSLTIWSGAMLGAALGFYLARTLGRPFLQHLVTLRRLEVWLSRLQDMDVMYLLAVRLLPIISFNLINYTLGLSPIGWWRFCWTTSIGIIPVTILAVVFGAYLQQGWMLVLTAGIALGVALSGYILLQRRRKLAQPR